MNLTSLVEFEHHSMAEMIRKENEEKKIKVKAPVTAKKAAPNFKLLYLRNGYLRGAEIFIVCR